MKTSSQPEELMNGKMKKKTKQDKKRILYQNTFVKQIVFMLFLFLF